MTWNILKKNLLVNLLVHYSTDPIRLNFCVDDQNTIFTCTNFDLTLRHGQAHAFLWTTQFQSGLVNPKSYFPSLATKVCGCVCNTGYTVLQTYTGPFRLNFNVDDQNSIFTFPVFDLTCISVGNQISVWASKS